MEIKRTTICTSLTLNCKVENIVQSNRWRGKHKLILPFFLYDGNLSELIEKTKLHVVLQPNKSITLKENAQKLFSNLTVK